MFRFTIRDVLWLTVMVGLSVGLWIEHRKYAEAVYALKDEQSRNTVIAELNKATAIECSQMPLGEMVKYFSHMHAVPVLLAPSVNGDTPITCNVKNVSLREGLQRMLHPHKLDFRVKDGAILVEPAVH